MKTIILSKRGYDFKGNKLTEKRLTAGVLVFWDGSFFETGNIRNNIVELYKDGEFIESVDFESIRLVIAPKKLYL